MSAAGEQVGEALRSGSMVRASNQSTTVHVCEMPSMSDLLTMDVRRLCIDLVSIFVQCLCKGSCRRPKERVTAANTTCSSVTHAHDLMVTLRAPMNHINARNPLHFEVNIGKIKVIKDCLICLVCPANCALSLGRDSELYRGSHIGDKEGTRNASSIMRLSPSHCAHRRKYTMAKEIVKVDQAA